MKGTFEIAGFFGLLLALYGVLSAVSSNATWYSYFVLGATLFLGYLNYRFGNDSVLGALKESRITVIRAYFFYLFAGIAIEAIGRMLFHFWYYPQFGSSDMIVHVYLIGYPFAFFSIYESFILIRKIVGGMVPAVFLTTLINAFIHEIPNTFAWEWIYTIPYITLEILKINVVVLAGWLILIAVPLIKNSKLHL